MTDPHLDDVALPTSPAGFDLDAWLEGAALPEKVAVVYGRGDLAAEYDALNEQLSEVRARRDDGMLNGGIDARRIGDRMTEIRDALLASKLNVRLRALPKSQQVEIRTAAEALPEEQQQDFVAEQWISACSVAPVMTVEQVRKLRARIGEGQFAQVWDEAWAASNEKRLTVPFSLQHSAALATPAT